MNSVYLDGGLPGMSEKKGRRIWSKRVTWVLLHAVHFFQTYREVGELEIALSFALLQMSLGHWSWKYLTGDLPRPAPPFREGLWVTMGGQ